MDIKKKILNDRLPEKLLILTIGIFILAINYNLYLYPNSLTFSGISGLSIAINKAFGIDANIFLYTVNILLLIICMFILGPNQSAKSFVGSLLFPFFISVTKPLCIYLEDIMYIDNIVVLILVVAIIQGFGGYLVYSSTFDTGGSDIIMRIINVKCHIPEGTATFIIQLFVLIVGLFVFGFETFIYGLIIVYIDTSIIDWLLIGVSKSKLFIINSDKPKEIQDFIINNLNSGLTIIDSEGAYSKKEKETILCVVSNRDYLLFKEKILSIDENAFIIVNDCYEVKGGKLRTKGSFINSF